MSQILDKICVKEFKTLFGQDNTGRGVVVRGWKYKKSVTFGGAILVPTGPGKPHMIQKIEKGESWQSSEHLAPEDLLLGVDDVDVTLLSRQEIEAELGKHQSIVRRLTLARNRAQTQVVIIRRHDHSTKEQSSIAGL